MTANKFFNSAKGEETISAMLDKTRGDLFRTAHALGVTPRELDSYIRYNPALQAKVAAIEQIKANPEYAKKSEELFRAELEERTTKYRLEGLEAIHQLATIPIDQVIENASLGDVKLRAAMQLRGAETGTAGGAEAASILSELNALYHSSAPRLKSMRATLTLEVQAQPEAGAVEVLQPSEPVPSALQRPSA